MKPALVEKPMFDWTNSVMPPIAPLGITVTHGTSWFRGRMSAAAPFGADAVRVAASRPSFGGNAT